MGCTHSSKDIKPIKPNGQACPAVLFPLENGRTATVNYHQYQFELESQSVSLEYLEHYTQPKLLAKCLSWVCTALDRRTNQPVAIKKNTDFDERLWVVHCLREIKVNRQLEHPNIVKMLDCFPGVSTQGLEAVYLVFGEQCDLDGAM